MATNKPQFHCYLDPTIHQELDAYSASTGVPKGKLIENLWRFFGLRDLPKLVDQMTLFLARGVSDKDAPHLYKLMIALQKALDSRM